jgi:large subunit ribosomal protein L29
MAGSSVATVTNREAAELRGITDAELVTRLREAKEELFNLRFQVATGQLDNNARLRSVRRNIARIYTVMRERELGIEYVSITTEELEASTPARRSRAEKKAEPVEAAAPEAGTPEPAEPEAPAAAAESTTAGATDSTTDITTDSASEDEA